MYIVVLHYPNAKSPNWSLYISIKNVLRGFDERSRHFLLSDRFINSHNLISWQCMDIVRRKLMLVTIGTCHAFCYLFEKLKINVPLHQLNSKTNGPVLLFKTLFRHWNCFLLSVAMDGKDGYGLKLEKVWPTVSSLHNCKCHAYKNHQNKYFGFVLPDGIHFKNSS